MWKELEYFFLNINPAKREKPKPSRIQYKLNEGEDELEKREQLKPSCIQCGKKHLYEIEIGKFEKSYIKYIGKVPKRVRDKIIQSMRKSRTYSPKEKETYAKL